MLRHRSNVIMLIYPDGLLGGEVGDLVVMPGIHRQGTAWGAYGFFSTQVLSELVTTINLKNAVESGESTRSPVIVHFYLSFLATHLVP